MIGDELILTGQRVVLREKRLSDAANDYAWRSDPELARFDAASPLKLSFREFMLYYTEQLRSLKQDRRWFAVDTLNGKHIGNCMYYDVEKNRKQAKIGVIIGDRDYWDKDYGTDAVMTLVAHIFEDMNLERVYLDTLEWNARAQRCFQKCGFVVSGHINERGHNFVIMELYKSWLKSNQDDNSQL
jgi:RimJ/RimL family protein N-acetyltransferase